MGACSPACEQVSIGSLLIFSRTASLDQSLCLNNASANALDTDNVSAISTMSCSLASCKSYCEGDWKILGYTSIITSILN